MEPPVGKPELAHHQIFLLPLDKEHLADTVDLARHRTSWVRLGKVYQDGISVEDHRRKVSFRRKEHPVGRAALDHCRKKQLFQTPSQAATRTPA
jgi:hypothetical protein